MSEKHCVVGSIPTSDKKSNKFFCIKNHFNIFVYNTYKKFIL